MRTHRAFVRAVSRRFRKMDPSAYFMWDVDKRAIWFTVSKVDFLLQKRLSNRQGVSRLLLQEAISFDDVVEATARSLRLEP